MESKKKRSGFWFSENSTEIVRNLQNELTSIKLQEKYLKLK